MIINSDQVEYIVWNHRFNKKDQVIIYAVGFVTEENDAYIQLSLTKSYDEFIDIQKIEKSRIIIRKHLSKNKLQ